MLDLSYSESKEGIREIKEILKGQFTEIKEIEGRILQLKESLK